MILKNIKKRVGARALARVGLSLAPLCFLFQANAGVVVAVPVLGGSSVSTACSGKVTSCLLVGVGSTYSENLHLSIGTYVTDGVPSSFKGCYGYGTDDVDGNFSTVYASTGASNYFDVPDDSKAGCNLATLPYGSKVYFRFYAVADNVATKFGEDVGPFTTSESEVYKQQYTPLGILCTVDGCNLYDGT